MGGGTSKTQRIAAQPTNASVQAVAMQDESISKLTNELLEVAEESRQLKEKLLLLERSLDTAESAKEAEVRKARKEADLMVEKVLSESPRLDTDVMEDPFVRRRQQLEVRILKLQIKEKAVQAKEIALRRLEEAMKIQSEEIELIEQLEHAQSDLAVAEKKVETVVFECRTPRIPKMTA